MWAADGDDERGAGPGKGEGVWEECETPPVEEPREKGGVWVPILARPNRSLTGAT